MRTILVDDHAIIIDGVKAILVQHPLVKVIHTAQSADEALQWFKTNEADLLITDYSMPGLDAVSFIKTVKRILPRIKIIILSMHEEIHLTKEILKSGVNAYILKKDTQKELLQAIEEVNAGRIYLSQDISKHMILNMDNPDEGKLLTEREKEILRLITQEYNNKQIAESLFISERTVETHRKNIFRKTGTNSLVGLIKFAFANNLSG
ncbi:MAG: response regulator transcription factor [Flammeovirgaceae bacterium]|jgi:two-component system nitrate/nitrite response regulator NarL|nr:response regulator transcription factor [Flammeovirgaceae bacterium]